MVQKRSGPPIPPITNQKIVKALKETNGLLYLAADILDITCQSLGQRINRTPELKELRADLLEKRLDIAEKKLLDAIKDAKCDEKGDITAIVFFLKTKGRHRGYAQDELTKENLSAIKAFMDMQRT